MVVQLKPMNIIVISVTEQEELVGQRRNIRISLAHRRFVTEITSPLSNWISDGGRIDFTNINWTEMMNNCSISSIRFQDMGDRASTMIHGLWHQKE
jgi:hypothetical protein